MEKEGVRKGETEKQKESEKEREGNRGRVRDGKGERGSQQFEAPAPKPCIFQPVSFKTYKHQTDKPLLYLLWTSIGSSIGQIIHSYELIGVIQFNLRLAIVLWYPPSFLCCVTALHECEECERTPTYIPATQMAPYYLGLYSALLLTRANREVVHYVGNRVPF
jgi:hypothetical protein